ncbi:MAG: type II secretion system protein GspG [bacterium]
MKKSIREENKMALGARFRASRRSQRGVALLSLALLASTVLIVASAMIPITMSMVDFEKRNRTKDKILLIQEALLNHYFDTGAFPAETGTLPLRRLYTNIDTLAGWQGSYLTGPSTDYLFDEWRRPFIYHIGTSTSAGPVAIVFSQSRNGASDTDLSNWQDDSFATIGDDISQKIDTFPLSKRLTDRNRNILIGYKAILYTAFPNSPPASYDTSTKPDAWGHNVVYRKCHNYAAVLLSYGFNGIEESGGGANICLTNRTGGDDMFVPLEWDLSAQATGVIYKGGDGGNENICRSYQMRITNFYPNDLTVVYYDATGIGSSNTQTISGNSSATMNGVVPALTAGFAVTVSYGGNAIEAFNPNVVDLNGDCVLSKIYGYEF